MHDAHARISALHEARRLLFLKLENMNDATREGPIEGMDVEEYGEVLDAIKDTKEVEMLHYQCIHTHHAAHKQVSMYPAQAATPTHEQAMPSSTEHHAPMSAGRLLTPHHA